jgi:hypothetical protein
MDASVRASRRPHTNARLRGVARGVRSRLISSFNREIHRWRGSCWRGLGYRWQLSTGQVRASPRRRLRSIKIAYSPLVLSQCCPETPHKILFQTEKSRQRDGTAGYLRQTYLMSVATAVECQERSSAVAAIRRNCGGDACPVCPTDATINLPANPAHCSPA